MLKIFKYLTAVLMSLLLIAVMLVAGLIVFVNPNNLKPIVMAQAKHYLHREVKIQGDLSWKFFPYLAVKMEQVEVDGVRINDSRVGIKLLPLLHRQLEINYVEMTGISISHQIKNASVYIEEIAPGKSFPIKIEFDAIVPSIKDTVHVKSVMIVSMNPELNQFRFTKMDTRLSHSVIDGRLTGSFILDNEKKQFRTDDLKGVVAGIVFSTRLQGSILNANPMVAGTISVSSPDLNATLKALDKANDAIRVAKKMKGTFEYVFSANKINVKGLLDLDTLIANNIKLTQIKARPHFQSGLLDMGLISANFYEGSLQITMQVNLKDRQPSLTVNGQVTNFSSAPLLNDLAGKELHTTLSSRGKVTFNVMSRGLDGKTILQNLNGVSQFSFGSGSMVGVDIEEIINAAYAAIKQQPVRQSEANVTRFNVFTGTNHISNGVFKCVDLKLDGVNFVTAGRGTVNLNNMNVNYYLQTTVKNRQPSDGDDWGNLYGIAIPIIVMGQLDNPKLRLDTSVLLQAVAKKQIEVSQKKIKSRLQNEIKKNIQGPAGDLLQSLIQEVR